MLQTLNGKVDRQGKRSDHRLAKYRIVCDCEKLYQDKSYDAIYDYKMYDLVRHLANVSTGMRDMLGGVFEKTSPLN